MARSEALRQEIDAMSGIERIMTALPPRTRWRVVGWINDQFSEPVPPPAESQAGAAPAAGEC
jgi:hypothetical protein